MSYGNTIDDVLARTITALRELLSGTGIMVQDWRGEIHPDDVRKCGVSCPAIFVSVVACQTDYQSQYDMVRLQAWVFTKDERGQKRVPMAQQLASGLRGALVLLDYGEGATISPPSELRGDAFVDITESGAVGFGVWALEWTVAVEGLQFESIDSAKLYFANTLSVARGGIATPEV